MVPLPRYEVGEIGLFYDHKLELNPLLFFSLLFQCGQGQLFSVSWNSERQNLFS
jgi:hypothetical protein